MKITSGKFKNWDLEVMNEAYVELVEGDQFVRLNHFVIATNPHGDRFRHLHNFRWSSSAEAYCEKMFNVMNTTDTDLDLDKYWHQIEAQYGSDAYLEYQEAEDVYAEYEADNFNL